MARPRKLNLQKQGHRTKEELQEATFAINILGGNVKDTYTFELPENAGERQMIIIDKRRQTSKKYPRKPGTPNKSPLVES